MGSDLEILKKLEESCPSGPPSLTTPCLTDELDWSLNLNDFELSLIRDFISDGSCPDDEALAVSSVTSIEFSDTTTVLPDHQSKSPENEAMDTALPDANDAIEVDLNSDYTTSEVVSGGKDRRSPTSSLPGMMYRGVKRKPGGRYTARIKLRKTEEKGKDLWLGTFNTAEEAAIAFDQAAFKYRGSQAVLNFPHLTGNDDDESPKYIPPTKGRRNRRAHRLHDESQIQSQSQTTEDDKEAFPGRRYRGIRQRGGRFSAEIKLYMEKKRKMVYLGMYDTEEEAAMAFDRAALKHRGSQAMLNFPHLIGTHADNPKNIQLRKCHRCPRLHHRLRCRNH